MDVKMNTRLRIRKMTSAVLKTAGCSLTLTILLSLLAGEMLSRRILKQDQSGYAVMLILFAVSAIAAAVFGREWGSNILGPSVMGALEYFILLMGITLFFYGGRFEAIGETALMITAGGLTAAMVKKAKGKKRYRR